MREEEAKVTGLRNERKPCHFWVDNEVADCYQAIVGADAIWVYCRIARNAHGAWIVSPKRRDGDTRVSLREMAEWCGKSVDTVWRCLRVLEQVGLLRAVRETKSSACYALADVKDLVTREGGMYDREIGSFRLPAARVAQLMHEVKELRTKLARKASGLKLVETVALSDSLERPLFAVTTQKCDRSVAPDVQICRSGRTDINLLEESKKARLTTPPNPLASEGDTTAPDASALDPGQIAHLERLADSPRHRAEWEQIYRDQNAERAEKAQKKAAEEQAERERIEKLKTEIPDRGAAREHVMRGCCFRENGRRSGIGAVIEDVLEMQEKCGNAPWIAAPRMVEAWRAQQRAGPELPRKLKPANFFGAGYWEDRNGWYWDYDLLRRQAQVSVGSR